jgi:hypothetical protein
LLLLLLLLLLMLQSLFSSLTYYLQVDFNWNYFILSKDCDESPTRRV